MNDSEINKAFDHLVKECPHGESNPQCPFEFFRNSDTELDFGSICSLQNKYLMLKYHSICNKIRTKDINEKFVKKAV